jgi:hypothetical protein
MQRMEGRRVVLFRGNGGRELLAETLAARGAKVDIVEAYRRLPPTMAREELATLLAGGALAQVQTFKFGAIHYQPDAKTSGPVAVVFGTVWVTPNVVWYGDLSTSPITECQSGGRRGKK